MSSIGFDSNYSVIIVSTLGLFSIVLGFMFFIVLFVIVIVVVVVDVVVVIIVVVVSVIGFRLGLVLYSHLHSVVLLIVC